MTIKNSTKWSTEDLRKLFRRCVKEVDKVEKPDFPFHKRNKHFELDILNTRYGSVRGRATIEGYWIMIKIPTRWEELSFEKRKRLAKVIIHEYYHTLGFKKQDQKNYKHDWTRKWDVDWVKDYPVREKEIIKKPKTDIKLARYQRAIKNFRQAETRLKRAKTLYNKWRTKIKYYQKTYNFN